MIRLLQTNIIMKTITLNRLRPFYKWSLLAWLLATLFTQRADAQACQFQQGQNGGVGGAVISPVDFARGNVNGSKAHYVEGNSVPYRIEFTTLTANTQYRALISFDVKKQTKHAMDYITGFQNLKYSPTDPAEQIDPLKGTGLEGLGSIVANTFAIPNPTFTNSSSYNTTATNSFTQLKTPAFFNPETTSPSSPYSLAIRDKGNMVIWNATINSIQYINTIDPTLSDVHATFEVVFTKANNANPVVLAWGGHIASTQTWGEGNSAHDIPGSPYHMFVETVEATVGGLTVCNGNMDCQLSSNAVSILPTCSITGPVVACPETNLLTYTAALDADLYGAVNYTWLLTNGTPSAGAQLSGTLTGSTTAASMTRNAVPIAADFLAGGNFRLQLTVERDGNSAVCYLNSTAAPGDSVLINNVVTTAAASPTSFSLNSTSTSNLSATTQLNGVTDNAAFNYAWAVTSAGGLNGGSLTGATTRTPQFIALNPGTYVFRVTATEIAAPNCIDIDSVTVVVTPAQICPTVPTASVCADTSTVTYTANAAPSSDVAYIWSVNNGAVITSSNGLQSVTVNPGTISFTLTLVLDYTNPSILNDTCSYPVTVNPLPNVNTGSYGPYCIDASPVSLSGTPSGGTWSGTGVAGSTFNVQTAGVGSHQIIYNYTDANGCSAADTTSITVNPLPVVNTGSYGPVCIDASPVSLSGTPSGGAWSGTGVTGSTFNVQTAGVGSHQLIYNYTDANGCSASDTTSITVNVCLDDDFCAYTQGYFGSPKGKACDGDSLYLNPVSLIRSLLLPGNIILGAGTRTITVTVNDSVRVNMVMPGGSTPRALTHTGNISMSQLGAYSYLNRQGRLNNVFLSQTLALSLNLRINPTLLHFILDSGYLITQKLANCGDTTTVLSCEMDSSAIESWMMNDKVVGYLAANGGATVENLLVLANKLLGQVLMPGAAAAGGTFVPSYSAVSGMVSTFNEAFDECRVFLKYDSVKMDCPQTESTQRYVDVQIEPVRTTIRANAFPNPYGKLIQFSLVANVSGQAELSLFDLSGQQLAQLYQGYWNAGDWRLLNYPVKPGQSVPMIYRFRVGKEVITGKLIPGN
jgi:hypothetical protein